MLLFLVTFTICFFSSYLFWTTDFAAVYFKGPIAELTAIVVANSLAFVGIDIVREGVTLFGRSYSLIIVDDCTPFYSIFLMLSAVAASPCNVKSKFVASVAFFAFVIFINTIRIAILFLTGNFFRKYAEIMHDQITQNISIVLVTILWIYWLGQGTKKKHVQN